jgi:sulfide:quinone oxidoreductase
MWVLVESPSTMTFVSPEPYIGHLGLDGVGDTKGMLESELRNRNMHWITNAKIDKVEENNMAVTEVNEDGSDKRQHQLEFRHTMILPAFKGAIPSRILKGWLIRRASC